ncbi:MAG TPA: N-formylglutamate amidohydrolase [Xanthomonadales bacterium]|nr:N-formylglutamate amidohydrolase [Xanthomonadales bacterium]
MPIDSRMPVCHRLDGRDSALLVLCDHAGNAIPEELGDLGLPPRLRRDHIAWDIGADGVARRLAGLLDCPALIGHCSRLVVDLNRHPDSPEIMAASSDGQVVPGNQSISETQRQARLDRYYHPYHDAIEDHLDRLDADAIRPLLVSIHSYTPELYGLPRPWLLGLLWKRRDPLIDFLLHWFRQRGIEIGDNQPYDGHFAMGHTLERHGIERGLRHILIELRQDQVYTPQQQRLWAERLAEALGAANAAGIGAEASA